ncbi:MAG TPA: hypothetical protein VFR58_14440 [Flavisolibacter sp.]|nr:hypothetical protein [Flavisolibacter sp.]
MAAIYDLEWLCVWLVELQGVREEMFFFLFIDVFHMALPFWKASFGY